MGEAEKVKNRLGRILDTFELCKTDLFRLMYSDWFLVFYLQGDGVQSEVPHISDGVIQSLLDALQLRGVLL